MFHLYHRLLEDFLYYTGSNNTSGVYYGFWSGFGSDIAELGIIGLFYRKFICHMHGCFRIGHHSLPYGTASYCSKHYKEVVKLKQEQHQAKLNISSDSPDQSLPA